ncbi:MAG: type II toxin-antitoxin system HicB family antitoxin [Candidatus Sumerlaeia bacterium]|nr:type II toxin-antitoxin system HicB family antitoxin [Candidatus Sumerlaeia bacterium]
MKFIVTLEPGEDGMWVCECPSIPGCVTQGRSRDGAVSNVREAIEGCLEARAELGLPRKRERVGEPVGGSSRERG